MKKIFISYKRQNKDKVFTIVEQIKTKTGIDYWMDLSGIESGDWFENTIIKAINECDILIFMLSKETLQVPTTGESWTQREVKFALRKNKRIIPISIDGTTVNDCDWLSFNCGGLDYTDFSIESHQIKLFNNLSKWCGTNLRSETFNSNAKLNKIDDFTLKTDLERPSYAVNIQDSSKISVPTVEEAKIINDYIKAINRTYRLVDIKLKDAVEKLANKGVTDAEFAIGYSNSKPYTTNIRRNDGHFEKAEYWLLKAANKNHLKAITELARIYYWTGEYQSCIKWAISVRDDIEAILYLSWSYLRLKDNTNYVNALKKAAILQEQSQMGNIHHPAFDLGELYYEGNSLAKDLQAAIHWFTVAMKYSYDLRLKCDAIYYLAKTYYELGKNKEALKILSESPGEDYGYYSKEIPKLYNEIKKNSNWLTKMMY